MNTSLSVDPATGQPVDPAANGDPAAVETVPKADFDALKNRLDAFEKGFQVGGQRAQQPAQPAQPSGPTLDDQLKEINGEVAKLNDQIDEAVKDGKPISALMSKRDELVQRGTRITIKAQDIDPFMNIGITALDQLSDRVTRGDMPHLDLVKDDFDEAIAQLDPQYRMNPQFRTMAYNVAVGKNVTKIMEAEKEKILREAAQPNNDEPTAGSRAEGSQGDQTPKPEDVLSADALNSIASVGKTPDTYYQGMGYKGWEDYYEKRLKPKEANNE